MEENKISIITICFNAEKYIEKTMLSVLNQTYNNIEYIIIDGASQDGTLELIHSISSKYSNRQIKVISEPDKGIYDAMNKGVKLASGEWLLMLNSGDMLSDDNVIKKIFSLQIPDNITVLFSDIYTIRNGKKIRSYIDLINKPMSFNHQNVIYRKKLHFEHGFYIVTPKIIISDILFFYSIPKEQLMKIDYVISIFELGGISSKGMWSNQQWLCADVIFRKRKFYSIIFVYIWILVKAKIPSSIKSFILSKRKYK